MPPGQGPLWGPHAKCGAPGAWKDWAYLALGTQSPGRTPGARHHLEGKHGTGGHVHQLVAAAEGTLRGGGCARSAAACAQGCRQVARPRPTHTHEMHGHTAHTLTPARTQGKLRHTHTDVSVSGYIQPPDHNTASAWTHDAVPLPDPESGSDTDLETARQFLQRSDACNTRVRAHTPGRATAQGAEDRLPPHKVHCATGTTQIRAPDRARGHQTPKSRRHTHAGSQKSSLGAHTARRGSRPRAHAPPRRRRPSRGLAEPGPHLADQLPAPVDAPRARVAQEGGDRRAASAPPPRPGLHVAGDPAGARRREWRSLRPTPAPRLWGLRAAGARLIG